MHRILLGAPPLLLLAACGRPDPQATWAASTTATDEQGPVAVLVVPNLDDDDGDGTFDWQQAGAADGDDDRATVEVANKARRTTIRLTGEVEDVRVYHEGELVLGEGAGEAWALPDRKRSETLTLAVEVARWGRLATLIVEDDRRERTAEIPLVGVAPTLGHHLLPTEQVFVVAVDDGPSWNNKALVDSLKAVMGDGLVVADGPTYGWDVWIQDEPEVLGLWTPEARADLVLDSIRDGNGDGGLDPFPETLVAPGTFVDTVGRPGDATTFDAFGNLEVTPPVDGHPLGRIYYGWNGDDGAWDMGPDPELRDFLASLEVQQPFWVDTSWLCVGHVDEVATFVPDPDAPRGFRFLFSDTALGFRALERREAEAALHKHGWGGYRGHGRPTIGSYTSDRALRMYNADLQRDQLEPMLEIYRTELGLLDEEIVRVPMVFEEYADEWGVCGAVALVPGLVNLLMITDNDGQGGTAILADPWIRGPDEPQSADVFIEAWREVLPPSIDPIFVDDWDVYHIALGEVHCGTNQRRTPALSRADLAAWTSEVSR